MKPFETNICANCGRKKEEHDRNKCIQAPPYFSIGGMPRYLGTIFVDSGLKSLAEAAGDMAISIEKMKLWDERWPKGEYSIMEFTIAIKELNIIIQEQLAALKKAKGEK